MDLTTTHPLVFGVDFSGAEQAGRKIWIAGGHEVGGRLVIDSCCRAADLPDGGTTRAAAYQGLRAFITGRPNAVFGIDAPFGVPHPGDRHACSSWAECILHRCAAVTSADDLRARFSKAGLGYEARRRSDRETGTPFAPANLRLYRQTYHAIRCVLAPLVRADAARVLPMQDAGPTRPVVIEICPATSLKKLGRFGPYKKRTADSRGERARILLALEQNGLEEVPPSIVSDALNDGEGDALDSMIAAWTVWRVRPRLGGRRPAQGWADYHREGYVYDLSDSG